MTEQAIDPAATTNLRLLVVDDDPILARLIGEIGRRSGFDVTDVGSFEAFKDTYADTAPDAIVLDLALADADGVEVLRSLAGLNCQAPVLVVSAFDERVLNTTARLGASYGLNILGTLRKPIKPADLRRFLDTVPRNRGAICEGELAHAIDHDQLVLHFQPKVAVATGTCVGAEALVRWNSPERGLVPPDEFIPLAESSGLIGRLTETVLDRAMAACAGWQGDGHDLTIAVNVSARSLTDLNFPDQVARLMNRHGFNPASLILEITETSAMTDTEKNMDVLARLRIKGAQLSLDDFGTGYSSLVELHRMPFGEMKIDKSFVMDCDRDQDARTIVQAIVSLAHNLGLKATAEGVESRAIWDLLVAAGCDYAQGYHLARPLPEDQFRDWLRDWRLE